MDNEENSNRRVVEGMMETTHGRTLGRGGDLLPTSYAYRSKLHHALLPRCAQQAALAVVRKTTRACTAPLRALGNKHLRPAVAAAAAAVVAAAVTAESFSIDH